MFVEGVGAVSIEDGGRGVVLVNHVFDVVVALIMVHVLIQGALNEVTEWCFRISGDTLVRIVVFKELFSKFPCTLVKVVRTIQQV